MDIRVHEAGPERARVSLERERSFVDVLAEDDATTVTVGKVEIVVSKTQTTVRADGTKIATVNL